MALRVSRRATVVIIVYAALAAALMWWIEDQTSTMIHDLLVNNPRPLAGQDPPLPETIAGISRSIRIASLLFAGLGLAAIAAAGATRRRASTPEVDPAGTRFDDRADHDRDTSEDGSTAAGGGVADAVSRRSHERPLTTRREGSSHSLRQLYDALEVGIVIVDASCRPRYVGDRAADQLRIGETADRATAAAARLDPLQSKITDVIGTGGAAEQRLTIDDGDDIHEYEVAACDLSGGPKPEAILMLRNRQPLPAIEQTLIEATRLRALARISLGVAHDLRAPINAVALNLANLKDTLLESGELCGDEHAETIEMLEEELRGLQRSLDLLLRQTSPWSRQSEVFGVAEMLSEVDQLLRAQARQQQLSFRVTGPADEIRILGQREWVKQAVVNLVVNAFDATPEGGRVEIELVADDDTARIIVTDSGPGIPDEILAGIFDAPGSSKKRGIGIGLMVARNAIESNGGSLELAHTGADGTTFEIALAIATGDDDGNQG